MIRITLSSLDREWATKVGRERWRRAQRMKSKARFAGAREVDHIDGAAGELAFCRALGLAWPAFVDSYHSKPDVYPNWEVRTLRRMSGVKVAAEDDDSRLVVWVRGKMPTFEIMGYILAGGAKQHDEWKRDPGGKGRTIWLCPPNKMVPIEPGFHDACGYASDDWGDWACVFCGAGVEESVA